MWTSDPKRLITRSDDGYVKGNPGTLPLLLNVV